MTFAGAVRCLNGLPGIILAGLAALVAFQMYVHQREQRAVERAAWVHQRDSLRHVFIVEAVAADARDKVRADAIKRLNARLTGAVTTAAAEGRRATVFHDELHALVDSNAAAKAALDSLEAAHAAQVMTLERAVAIAAEIHRVDEEEKTDLRGRLAAANIRIAEAIEKADRFERRANPGWVRVVLEHPVTHIVAAGVGYAAGSR